MISQRAKIIAVATAALLVAIPLIVVGLVVSRPSSTRNWTCKNRQELYYIDPLTGAGTCFQSDVQGPCGNNMALLLDKRNKANQGQGIGICACDVNHFQRTMVYHAETKQCYFVFTKAFCGEGEWLSVAKNRGPFCEPRLCEERPLDQPELVPVKWLKAVGAGSGLEEVKLRCVELGKSDNVTCDDQSQTIRFFKRKLYPGCVYLGRSIANFGSLGDVAGQACPVGHFSTGTGSCVPDWDFD